MSEDDSAILTRLALFSSHAEVALSASWKTSTVTVLGVGRPGAPAPEQGAEGEAQGPAPPSGLAQALPHPLRPLPAGHLGALTQAEPSTPQAQAQTDGGEGNTPSTPRKWGRTGGQESWALVPAQGLSSHAPQPAAGLDHEGHSWLLYFYDHWNKHSLSSLCPQGVQGTAWAVSGPISVLPGC